MLKVACPACSKTMRFQEKYLGRKIHCPGCGHPQVLSQPEENADRSAADEPTLSPREASTPKPKGLDSAATNMPQTLALDKADRFRNRSGDRTNANAGSLGGAISERPMGGSFLAPPEEPDEIGRLGGYRILSQLGAGGMGVVFLAEDVALSRKIAVKALPPDVNDDPAARDRFVREARAAARLEHENIVTVHQVGEDRGVLYLAMQLLKGRPLDQYFYEDNESQPLPLDEVLQIGREICAGLAVAHEHNVIHRDIKPANIWLEDVVARSGAKGRRKFRVKILDFGLARRTQEKGLTQSGIIVGTPSYMSPEQARGPNVDGRSDLFSLGCVLYEISTGRRPFSGNDAISVLSSLAADTPNPPAEINPEIPFELSDLILDLLEKDPERRPSTAHDVAERLEAIDPSALESHDTARLPASKLKPPRKRTDPSKLWLWIGGGATLACLLIGIIVWAVVASSPPNPAVKAKDKAVKDVKKDVKVDQNQIDLERQLEEIRKEMALKKQFDDDEKRRKDAEKLIKDDEKRKKDAGEWDDPQKKGKKGKKGPEPKGFDPQASLQPSRLERPRPEVFEEIRSRPERTTIAEDNRRKEFSETSQ